MVEKRSKELGSPQELPPQAVALAQRIREEALGVLARSQADGESRIRDAAGSPGEVPHRRIDRSADRQPGEGAGVRPRAAERTLGAARAARRNPGVHCPRRALITRLKDVKVRAGRRLPRAHAPAVQQCHDKGPLVRPDPPQLVRIGRLEFILDPEQASKFNFSGVRKGRGVSTRPEMKKNRRPDFEGVRGMDGRGPWAPLGPPAPRPGESRTRPIVGS